MGVVEGFRCNFLAHIAHLDHSSLRTNYCTALIPWPFVAYIQTWNIAVVVPDPVMNKNIVATFAFRFSSSLAQGIWDYNALPQYIYILENYSSQVSVCVRVLDPATVNATAPNYFYSTQAVGLIEGLQGTCTALSGFPGGCFLCCIAWVKREAHIECLGGSCKTNL